MQFYELEEREYSIDEKVSAPCTSTDDERLFMTKGVRQGMHV